MQDSSSDSESNAIQNNPIPEFENELPHGSNQLDDGDNDSSSSGSEYRPHFLRDSSGSDSDYHRYMKNNFITEVYHAKDYDYSTNDDLSNVSSHFSRNTSRSSSFTSAVGEVNEVTIDRDEALGSMMAAGKYHADSSSEDGSSEGGRRGSPRRPLRLSQQMVEKLDKENSRREEEYISIEKKDIEHAKQKQSVMEPPQPPSEHKAKEKQSSITSVATNGTSGSSQEDAAGGIKHTEDKIETLPPKPPKPVKLNNADKLKSLSSNNADTQDTSTTTTTEPVTPMSPKSIEMQRAITVTSDERSLVTSGVEDSFYLDGSGKFLISSPTDCHASLERDHQDMFLSQFIPSPKKNVKSLSWHISITDNSAQSGGYHLSIYKVLLRRSKSWCGGNNWTLFIDGKHVATGKVPLFTMSSEIRFEMPSSESGTEKQMATIEIRRKAWYRRKLNYKFKIGGNEYPTFYAQPVDLYQALPPSSQQETVEDPASSSSTTVKLNPPSAVATARPELDEDKASSTAHSTTGTPAHPKRGSASSAATKALSSSASTLKSSATASALPKSKSITRSFSPAQMLITIPSTNTEVSSSGKQKIYYQILIRIPALPQPIVVERRYKHFSQLWSLLRGELALTMEESLRISGGVDKENKSISNACEAKLSQFPMLPPKVYNPMVDQKKPDFIKSRRLALQSFLIELMSYDPKIVHCSEFLGFLGLHPITCTSILKE
mmetsp:Transcript_24054/g.44652  ORF Transcript_24054/g.44652 Transcript_24054/m.44652 type:complete len:718 (-) Transcript_24054:219-2372(-)